MTTDAITIPRTAKRPVSGIAWWPVYHSAGRNSILFQCPNGHVSNIGNHTIESVTGAAFVSPSVGCRRCDFHAHISLESWDPALVMGFYQDREADKQRARRMFP